MKEANAEYCPLAENPLSGALSKSQGLYHMLVEPFVEFFIGDLRNPKKRQEEADKAWFWGSDQYTDREHQPKKKPRREIVEEFEEVKSGWNSARQAPQSPPGSGSLSRGNLGSGKGLSRVSPALGSKSKLHRW